jgi:phenylacetate-coenzyme A ligase PaaK-like adenylate-forming protein
MYFDVLKKRTGKRIKDIFPDFSVFVHGGVNFEPYKAKLFESIGKEVDTIETYPASEGFFAFQDSQKETGLLLNTNSGIFYEFVPVEEISKENPTRLTLKDVEVNKNYALIINSNAGLWAYNIGDTLKFVSLNPYRIVVTGRVKHFISAFGEHVIGEEVEDALMKAADDENIKITEFTVAPNISTTGEKSFHEWYIEFENIPKDLERFAERIDANLRKKNIYYDDLIKGNILQPLKLHVIQKEGFINYMKSVGKLGGQNKVPRLSNDRKLANKLQKWIQQENAESLTE